MTVDGLREVLRAWARWRNAVSYPGCAIAAFGQDQQIGFRSKPPSSDEMPADVRDLREGMETLQGHHSDEMDIVQAWYLRGGKTCQELARERHTRVSRIEYLRRMGETRLAGWMSGRGW